MLTVTHLKSSAASITGYVEHGARMGPRSGKITGYYDNEQLAPSFWHGSAAVATGRTGEVARDDLAAALTGEGFGLRATQASGHRRPGSDLTFSAPKSVSVVGLASDADESAAIKRAHDAAVAEALDYIEQHVLSSRAGAGGAERVMTGSMMAAVYRHEDSRPVDGVADPQLHSHAIVANLTQREDGQWRTIDLDFGKDAERWQIADHVYKAALESRMNSLGYETVKTANGFEVNGVDQSIIDTFSRRRLQIDDALADEGKTRDSSSAKDRTQANLDSRGDKGQLPAEQQREEWQNRARDAGLNTEDLKNANAGFSESDQKALADMAVEQAVADIAERDERFERDLLIRKAFDAVNAGVRPDAIIEAVDQSDAVIPVSEDHPPGREQYTTRAAAERAGWLRRYMQATQSTTDRIASGGGAVLEVERYEQQAGFALSAGQRNAVETVLSSSDRLTGIRGAAGAGKTTALAAVSDSARRAGHEVIGIAPSSVAAGALDEAGCNTTRTIASYLAKEPPRDTNAAGRMVIVDEAGMVSSKQMQQIIESLSERDRLVLVGDQRQLQAVEAGTPFADLQDAGMRTAEIGEIRRQQNADQRRIARLFAEGHADEGATAAQAYMTTPPVDAENTDKRGMIARAAAEQYVAMDRDERSRTAILSGTRAVRDAINHEIRDRLSGVSEGGVDTEQGVAIETRQRFDMTKAQRGNIRSWANALDEARGNLITSDGQDTLTVTGVDLEAERLRVTTQNGRERWTRPEAVADHTVMETRTLDLAPGDRVQATRNDKAIGLKNGQIGEVVSTDIDTQSATIRMTSGETMTIEPEQGAGVDYAFAQTIHAAQGATVDQTIVAGEAGRTATAEAAYVALSRQRHNLSIVTDNAEKLTQKWSAFARQAGPTQIEQPSIALEQAVHDGEQAGQLAAVRAVEGTRTKPASTFEQDKPQAATAETVETAGAEPEAVTPEPAEASTVEQERPAPEPAENVEAVEASTDPGQTVQDTREAEADAAGPERPTPKPVESAETEAERPAPESTEAVEAEPERPAPEPVATRVERDRAAIIEQAAQGLGPDPLGDEDESSVGLTERDRPAVEMALRLGVDQMREDYAGIAGDDAQSVNEAVRDLAERHARIERGEALDATLSDDRVDRVESPAPEREPTAVTETRLEMRQMREQIIERAQREARHGKRPAESALTIGIEDIERDGTGIERESPMRPVIDETIKELRDRRTLIRQGDDVQRVLEASPEQVSERTRAIEDNARAGERVTDRARKPDKGLDLGL